VYGVVPPVADPVNCIAVLGVFVYGPLASAVRVVVDDWIVTLAVSVSVVPVLSVTVNVAVYVPLLVY
jgi:hypothetical protein